MTTTLRIGILGGSFDPPHNAHIKLGKAALKQLKLDRVYYVLSPRAPLKSTPSTTPVPVKLRMLNIALKGQNRLAAARWEIGRQGPSYTITTLRHYRRKNPSHELYLIMGSDSFRTFPRWKNPNAILKITQLVVGLRPHAPILRRSFPYVTLKGSFPDLSSTELRRRLKKGKSVNQYLPVKVRNYIRVKKLYVRAIA